MNRLNHVAFIMDGNGRWGKKRGKGRNFGHLKGVETVKNIVKSSIKLDIPIITFYVFSSENWKRPKQEINFLFKLIKNYFSEEIESIIKQGIKINILGEAKKLSSDIKLSLKKTISLTKNNKNIIVNLAINYGSKNEILNAFKKTKNKLTRRLCPAGQHGRQQDPRSAGDRRRRRRLAGPGHRHPAKRFRRQSRRRSGQPAQVPAGLPGGRQGHADRQHPV